LDLRVGDVVFGADQSHRYTVEEFIGHGGFGLIYRIRNTSDDSVYALKTIITASLNSSQLQSLVNEGNLATKVIHPNVIRYLFFHDGEQYPNLPPYIIMEYAEAGDLERLINQRRENNDLFSREELEEMLLQLAQGIQAINQTLIHRDIRPSNVLLVESRLKISDFGLSKVVGQATRSRTFKGIQHIAYMAPEAWTMDKNTIQMDMYSMGIVFYELGTLKHPYNVSQSIDAVEAWRQAHLFQVPEPLDAVNSDIPPHLAQTIMRMIKKRPEERHDSWDDIIRRIQGTNEPTTSQSSVRMQNLIQKARSVQQQRDVELTQIQMENASNQQRRDIVIFKAEQLHNQIKQVIDEFNQGFDGPQLRLTKTSQDWLLLQRPFVVISGQSGDIRIFLDCLKRHLRQDRKGKLQAQEQMMFQNRPVWAWGYVLARSGKGFNLLLVPNNQDDLYGSWWCLPITHTPIVPKSDNRPDPFPFQQKHELAEFLPLMKALHIHQTEPVPFGSDLLIGLLEETV